MSQTYAGNSNCSLYGVCNGHGENGHEVAKFVSDAFPSILADEGELLVNPRCVVQNGTNQKSAGACLIVYIGSSEQTEGYGYGEKPTALLIER